MEAKNEITIIRNIRIQRVLCSPRFKDVAKIVPKELNSIPIELNYKETSMRHVKKTYFNHFQYLDKKL